MGLLRIDRIIRSMAGPPLKKIIVGSINSITVPPEQLHKIIILGTFFIHFMR